MNPEIKEKRLKRIEAKLELAKSQKNTEKIKLLEERLKKIKEI
jgi:hypothetical protein